VADESASTPAYGRGRKLPVKNTQNVYLSFSDLNGFYDYVASQLVRSA
jgi:hypothetical protein